MTTDKYSVILADPPWYNGATYFTNPRVRRRNKAAGIAMAAPHYDTMVTSDISLLPISGLADKDAVLFMWTISGRLHEAPALMAAWGFKYLTVAFSWVKTTKDGRIDRRGLGAYTKQNIELCLLGIRGNPYKFRKARDVHQVIMQPRREHSRKPDQQYGRIMRLFDGPYLELFARQQWPGWDVWGNQTNLFPAQPFLFDEGMAA